MQIKSRPFDSIRARSFTRSSRLKDGLLFKTYRATKDALTKTSGDRDFYKRLFEVEQKRVVTYMNENSNLWLKLSKFDGGLEEARRGKHG